MSEFNHSQIEIGDYSLFLAEIGEGPLVLFTHGFPESWYSWRHQLKAVAKAGYKAVAMDMPGYGESNAPQDINAYNPMALSDLMAALATKLGYETFYIIGHDWGTPAAWYTAVRFPERVKAVVGMSVPWGGLPPQPPTEGFKRLFTDKFFYMLYFQQLHAPEAELEKDIPGFLRRFFWSCTGENPQGFSKSFSVDASASIYDAFPDPGKLPSWMSQEEMDYFISRYEKSGLRGPINYYRCLDTNWHAAQGIEDWSIKCPALFLYGDRDPIPKFGGEMARMEQLIPNLTQKVYEDCGHWTQQEKAEEVSLDVVAFLRKLTKY